MPACSTLEASVAFFIDILELLAAGANLDEILAGYPFLEREDVYAAIEYAAHQTDHTVLQAS